MAALFCLGAFLRIYNFWLPYLWMDEYGTWWALATGNWVGVARRVLFYHGQSPLYYFIVKLSSDLFGIGAFSRDDDLILLRTGFVEGDLLARSNPDPLLVSAVRWPLDAHLPSGHSYKIADLPFHTNDKTRPYLYSILSEAPKFRRVWMIDYLGSNQTPVTLDLARALVSGSHFRLRERISYGTVWLLVLEQ